MTLKGLLIETLRSGTIASVVIMPLGLLFRAMGLRIGHYGPKFAGLFIDNPQTWQLLVQHFVIGWLATLPLLLIFIAIGRAWWPMTGAIYGAAFYVVVNSLVLPLYFGDPTPWQLGWSTIYPSLIGHVAFGLSIAVTAQRFLRST
jgi:uncharacterized membrane protein YagU involved in acid resistance